MTRFNRINYKLVLVIVFIILYLPHCFILVNDISLILAYEVDPGSIIDSIEKLYSGKIYNMLNGYHSKYYGWTYMSINFWLLAPIKLFNIVFNINSKLIFYLSLKFIYFLIGLILTIILYILAIKTNKNSKFVAAFMPALLLLLLPTSQQFYFIHPETTGALFLIFGMLVLSKFNQVGINKYYIIGIVCLSLASLSKQIYFFTAIPIFITYFLLGLKKYNKKFSTLLVLTLGFGAFSLLIVHPYAYLYPKMFLGYQFELSSSMVGGNQIGYIDSIKNWTIFIYRNTTILILPMALSPFLFVYGYLQYKKTYNFCYLSITLSSACAVMGFATVAYGNRVSLSHHYLFPVYIFLLVIISFVIDSIMGLPNKRVRLIGTISIIYVFIVASLYYAYDSIPNSINRLNFEKSVATVSYNYINQKLRSGNRLVMDYQIAVPANLGIISCGMWTGCGTESAITSFKPEYVMFNQEAAAGISPAEFSAFKNFVEKNNYNLIDKLSVQGNHNIFTGQRTSNTEILVYKR